MATCQLVSFLKNKSFLVWPTGVAIKHMENIYSNFLFIETMLLPNFVKENFVGKSVMRTRCLECEASTYRSETFTNIDIPLTFDPNDCHVSGSDQEGSDGQNDVKDLFLKQIMASETLRENNKYWCSECSRLNEAQRSVQYELLPQVMVSRKHIY